jgi:hypothetical protein
MAMLHSQHHGVTSAAWSDQPARKEAQEKGRGWLLGGLGAILNGSRFSPPKQQQAIGTTTRKQKFRESAKLSGK